MSRSMNCRPSDVLHLEDQFEAYALDSAVVRWGVSFEAAIAEAGRDAKDAAAAERKQNQVIRRWLPETRKYADPRRRNETL
jgi:hypothetical protein